MAPPADTAVKKSAHALSRHRGLEPPFNGTYVATIVAFLFLSSTHYALYVPCVHWAWYAATSALLAIAVPCWCFVALYDPVDPYCRANTQSVQDGLKFCNHCACYTSNDSRTRHCYDCRKCVPGFDHHCVYLQTCIGQHNYPIFFTLISTVWLWCILVTALDVLLVVPSSLAPFGLPANACIAQSTTMVVWYSVLLGVHALLCVGGFMVVSSLLLFHCIICFKRQTTYEWLVEDMMKKRDSKTRGHDSRTLGERFAELRDKATATLGPKCTRAAFAVSTTRSRSSAASADMKRTQETDARQIAITVKG